MLKYRRTRGQNFHRDGIEDVNHFDPLSSDNMPKSWQHPDRNKQHLTVLLMV